MSTVTGTVEAVSTKYDKFSVLVNDTWYATKQEWAPDPLPKKGDKVTFENGGKKFLSKCKILGSGGSTSSGGSSGSKNFNIGVEVGHASNLAMRVVEKMELTPGSEDFYRAFAKETENIFKLMKALRKNLETQESSGALLQGEKDAKEKPKAEVTSDDIF